MHNPWITTPLICAALLVVAGCASNEKYYWGHYENLVYVNYANPGSLSPAQQAQTMEEDMQKAKDAGKPVPPGFHAQLGYLYYQLGKTDAARVEFEAEKRQFPESSVLMDRMLAHLSRT